MKSSVSKVLVLAFFLAVAAIAQISNPSGGVALSTVGQGYFFGYTVYPVPAGGQGTAGDFQTVNRVYVYQFVLPFSVTVRKVSINIQTGLAASHINVGIYDNNGNKLLDSGAFDTSVTGILTTTLGTPVTLPAGLYFAAQSSDSNSASLAPLTGANPAGLGPGLASSFLNANASRIAHATNLTNAGVLPATLGTLTVDAFSFPLISLFEP